MEKSMDNGLMLTLEEFESLPKQKQLSCLYQNQVYTMKLIKGYRLYYKITTIIGSILVIGMGILFNFHLGK
jgi:hypothetical protein